ncbi:phasin family protein [Paenibacillus sp. IITD108]|uniref:phasin family protein n=1 Tax=Paenibacillus sp. IITD108 TaxID=3116649 RepID=UPI002F3FFC5C
MSFNKGANQMKDFVNRAVSLGLGIVVESKEQIEKAVDELVKKGELSREESASVVNEMVEKGEQLRGRLETIVKNKLNDQAVRNDFATKEELQALTARIEKLEQSMQS